MYLLLPCTTPPTLCSLYGGRCSGGVLTSYWVAHTFVLLGGRGVRTSPSAVEVPVSFGDPGIPNLHLTLTAGAGPVGLTRSTFRSGNPPPWIDYGWNMSLSRSSPPDGGLVRCGYLDLCWFLRTRLEHDHLNGGTGRGIDAWGCLWWAWASSWCTTFPPATPAGGPALPYPGVITNPSVYGGW